MNENRVLSLWLYILGRILRKNTGQINNISGMDKCEDQKSEKYVCACVCARFLSKVIMKVFWLR